MLTEQQPSKTDAVQVISQPKNNIAKNVVSSSNLFISKTPIKTIVEILTLEGILFGGKNKEIHKNLKVNISF